MTTTTRSGTLLGRADLSLTNSARTFDYLDRGKDSWSQDRHVAGLMAEASPDLVDQMALHREARETILEAVCGACAQVVVLGCGAPATYQPAHEYARVAWGSRARTIYVDHDLAVLAAVRAWWERPARIQGQDVRVLDWDLRDAEGLVGELGRLVDLSEPVGVVTTLVLDHLDDYEAGQLAKETAARLTPGSRWGITHLADAWGAADAYTRHARDQGADTQLVARTQHELRALLGYRTSWGWWEDLTPRTGAQPPITDLVTLI